MRELPIIIFASAVLLFAFFFVFDIGFMHYFVGGGPHIVFHLRDHSNDLLGEESIFKMAITIIILLPSIFIILSSRYNPKDKYWAYATVGTLLGYWLR
jgi:hypothetical protein